MYNLKAVHFICLGFGGRAVTALILRGFRLSGRFLLHVLSNGVSLASRIGGVVWWESGELFCVGWVVRVGFGFGERMGR